MLLFVLFIAVYQLIGTRGKLQLVTMFADEGVNVSFALVFQYLVNGNEDTCLLYIAKTIINSRTKKFGDNPI